jgi:hypothetical protein
MCIEAEHHRRHSIQTLLGQVQRATLPRSLVERVERGRACPPLLSSGVVEETLIPGSTLMHCSSLLLWKLDDVCECVSKQMR